MATKKKQSASVKAEHEFPALVFQDSEVLILGSFPSIKSRAISFYYGHPQNRFWRLIERKYGLALNSVDEKRTCCQAHHIALYDVIDSCEIIGSSDASIKNVVPTDLESILARTPIHLVIANGTLAGKLLAQYHPSLPCKTVTLPSTSPANAAWSLDRLFEVWGPYLP